jgi:hypothetical protein
MHLSLVTQMGQSDGETAYSLPKLIMQALNAYNDAFFFTLYILALIIIAAVWPGYLKSKFNVNGSACRFYKMGQYIIGLPDDAEGIGNPDAILCGSYTDHVCHDHVFQSDERIENADARLQRI